MAGQETAEDYEKNTSPRPGGQVPTDNSALVAGEGKDAAQPNAVMRSYILFTTSSISRGASGQQWSGRYSAAGRET
jgi:hypothetical protein